MSLVTAFAMFLWSPMYIIPTSIGGFVIWHFWRPRQNSTVFDWLLFVFPWFIWFPMLFASPQQKSLGNFAESYIVTLIALTAFALRMYLGPRIGQKKASFLALFIACAGGAIVAVAAPTFPE